MTLTGSSGKIYALAGRPFAAGGEGEVYGVINEPRCVAKIFHQDRRTDEVALKLKTLVSTKNKSSAGAKCAWPTDLLFDANKTCVGFVMEKAKGEKLIDILNEGLCLKDYRFCVRLAANIAAAVESVHSLNQVIGDLNPRNILVDRKKADVTLIDTDSYQISAVTAEGRQRILRCHVTTPLCTPRELQGVHFPTAPLPTFTEASDNFALAVLMFQLLMNGAHPFTCRQTQSMSRSFTQFQPESNISRGITPFFTETLKNRQDSLGTPMSAPEADCLPAGIIALFRQAFVAGHKQPGLRPGAKAWRDALRAALTHLVKCSKNARHSYFQESKKCPWCDVEKKMQITAGMMKKADACSRNAGAKTLTAARPYYKTPIPALRLAVFITSTVLLAVVILIAFSRYVLPEIVPALQTFDGSKLYGKILNSGRSIIYVSTWLCSYASLAVTQYFVCKKKNAVKTRHYFAAVGAAAAGCAAALPVTYLILGLCSVLVYVLIVGLVLGAAALVFGG